ncbi:sensor histidine kinase [Streptomyces erythrochromogenes]|uniref:sensor histidine kinase n=1 Tax=Streptomyces erythrochromogenes TaxID=285574 RepID=UPI00131BA345|nr:ATP-binding protein [Streptomyces erythrochromogenes]
MLQSLPLRRIRALRGTTSVGSGTHRAQSFLVVATLLYRGSHLTVAVMAVAHRPWHLPLQHLGLAAALGLSVLTYGTALRRGRFDRRHIWADVIVTGCVLPLALCAWGGVREPPTIAWAMLLGGSASAAAAIALDRLHALAVVALLVVTHFIGYQAVGATPAVIVGHLNSLVSSALMTYAFRWYLLRQGRLLDEANARALAAEAHKARYAERLEHHRALHDTVLATLTTLAAGTLDANAPEVRQRCAREAAYLRRLIQQTADEVPHREIGEALEEAVGSVESLGLRVTAQYHALPQVPPEVAAALGHAVREALNNVRRHAGTGHAYLTATGDPDGGAVVTVVDRGPGFDPARCEPGLGLRGSVQGRMTEAGGRATVDTAPGEGVRVELRWPG